VEKIKPESSCCYVTWSSATIS